MRALRVGCLAWGSLLWDPRTLPLANRFQSSGPDLPIEFSRVALDGRVTLVIDPAADQTRAYWGLLSVSSSADAIEALGIREKVAREKWGAWIGLQAVPGRCDGEVESGAAPAGVRSRIARWLQEQELDAVVWTALPARSPGGLEQRPGIEELLAHLRSLKGEALARAEEYIRRAPGSLRTPNRSRFEAEFGWVGDNQN